MESTYLIQRLGKPRGFINPFSFGVTGNGMLSKEAQNLLKNIWSFDYMGSAEFEFGAIPKALQKIAIYCVEGRASTSTIKLGKDVYYICEKKDESEVVDRIKKLAKCENKFNLKEYCGLEKNLKGEGYTQRLKGWLELNNGFMFFVDKEMYDTTSTLFLSND
jgi:hypothetical protein